MNYAIYSRRGYALTEPKKIDPLLHVERLALSEQINAPKPRLRIHHIYYGGAFVTGIIWLAERTVHFLEVPAEVIWAIKVVIFKEL